MNVLANDQQKRLQGLLKGTGITFDILARSLLDLENIVVAPVVEENESESEDDE
jgi:hypothetical protein